ncbi:MAG: hypothetical protein JXA90_12385, partial [Planctomycetes bacterium]|nr:hypothetical protein [Planctomycetota bacterium]
VRGAQTLLLHQDAIDHVHGLSDMVLEEIAVQPGDVCTDSNPTVRLVAQIRNRGEVTEAGEIHGEVWHVDTGKCLAVFSQDFEKVEPGGRIDFSADWRPGEMLEGSYRAVFRVDCEGGSAPVRVHEFAGCRPMELFVVPDADSYTQCQTAIVFARAVSGGETVETARYSARVTNPMGSAQFISLEAHPLEGAYFLLSFNPRYGDGVYEVRVSASADGYHTEAAYCSVVLSRNPAVLWPQRMHACADGKTVVTIDLGPVFTTHGWNPLINEYWDGRALHGFDPIFGDPWRDGPPLGWDRAVDGGVPLALVPDRTLATLTATAGEILNPDVNGKIPGIQIFLTGGRAEVLLQAPEDAGVAHVLAETEEAESLGFTRVEFTTADPNENEQRWCVGDIRRSALARGSVSPAGAYSDAFDLDADGAVSTQDVMAAAGSWGSSDPGAIHPPGASDLRRAAAIILRGDWEDAFAGQTFEIRIDVRAGEPLSGVDIVLDYDPEVIEPVDVQLGGWLSEGSGILTLGPILTTGRLRMGAVRRDRDDPGLTGEGTAVAIEARVLSAGPMGLALRGAIAAGPDGSDLPVILVSEDREAASGTGSLRGDANSDGSQDISDAIYILSCLFLGGPCPTSACAADSNNDGSRDISDAVFLLSFLFLGGPAPAPCP